MIDAYELAILPLARMLNKPEPYDRYCAGVREVGEQYRELVSNTVWGYQLHTYATLVRHYFGKDVQLQVRQHQQNIFGNGGGGANAFSHILALIDRAVNAEPVKILVGDGKVPITTEMQVARTMLLASPLSPDYVADATQRRDLVSGMGAVIDWHLADYLYLAREEIIIAFSSMLAHYDPDPDAGRDWEGTPRPDA